MLQKAFSTLGTTFAYVNIINHALGRLQRHLKRLYSVKHLQLQEKQFKKKNSGLLTGYVPDCSIVVIPKRKGRAVTKSVTFLLQREATRT